MRLSAGVLALGLASAAADDISGWVQISKDSPGDCVCPERPPSIQTKADTTVTIQDCVAWFNKGCPNNQWPGDPRQLKGCFPGTNAIGFDSKTGICRVQACHERPVLDTDQNWQCYYGGQPLKKALPTYPPLENMCLTTDSNIPQLEGVMTFEDAQQRCTAFSAPEVNNCAGFWYNTADKKFQIGRSKYFQFHFNSDFRPVPAGSGSCVGPSKAKVLLGAQLLNTTEVAAQVAFTPEAIQQVFHFAYAQRIPNDDDSLNQDTDYAGAAGACYNDDKCTGYMWDCPDGACSCDTFSAAGSCEAKFPTGSKKFFFSLSPSSYADDSSTTNAMVKYKRVDPESPGIPVEPEWRHEVVPEYPRQIIDGGKAHPPHVASSLSDVDGCTAGSSELCSCSQLLKAGAIHSIDECTQEAAIAYCKKHGPCSGTVVV